MSDLPQEWLQMWERPGVPTWGIGSDMTIRFLNRRAEEILGMTSAEAKGKPCHEVVKGLDGALAPFCCKDCPIFAASQSGTELEPETLLLGENGSPKWAQVLPIVVEAPDDSGSILIESAVDVDRWARIEGYIKKVAARDRVRFVGEEQKLTRREREILGLLAEGFVQADIASRLHVHYTTVRTHVQRILAKLGVHSIQAAVAHHLLAKSAEE